LLGIVSELKELVHDLKNRIVPLQDFVRKISASHQVNDDIVEYLEVKQQVLMSYCVNVIFYLYMKAQGKSVQNHPVMKQLLKLRYVMEKMRPLDGKLKHLIDRLVQVSELSPSELRAQQQTDLLRPNPSALLANASSSSSSKKKSKKQQDSDDEDEEEEEEVDPRGGKKQSSRSRYAAEDDDEYDNDEDVSAGGAGLYKVPKRTAVPYKQSETEMDRREQRLEKQKSKLKRSELMETLREEFGSAPEAAASSGLGLKSGDLAKLQEEADERTNFEEDRFVRLVRFIWGSMMRELLFSLFKIFNFVLILLLLFV
jgi:hypothetical protein